MQMTPADIADRFSILDLKMDRFPPEEAAKVAHEHAAFRDVVWRDKIPIEFCMKLKEINGRVFDLEYDVRMGILANPKTEAEFAEIGRRTIAIRDINRERIAAKNEISATMGGYQEIKALHASA